MTSVAPAKTKKSKDKDDEMKKEAMKAGKAVLKEVAEAAMEIDPEDIPGVDEVEGLGPILKLLCCCFKAAMKAKEKQNKKDKKAGKKHKDDDDDDDDEAMGAALDIAESVAEALQD